MATIAHPRDSCLGRQPAILCLLSCSNNLDVSSPCDLAPSYPDFLNFTDAECTVCHGLSPEIGRAYVAVDNKLFLWDYTTKDNVM